MIQHKVKNDWQSQGICRVRQLPVDIFFPAQGEKVSQEAVFACEDCPVQEKCLEHALRHEQYGYWAGTTESQRVSIRKSLKISIKTPQSNYTYSEDKFKQTSVRASTALHGTVSGYNKHMRDRTRTCQACKDAKAADMREYKKRKRVAS